MVRRPAGVSRQATPLTLFVEYPGKETRDMILATGMVEGMEASYARLESALLTV